jgi:hypothetical protein
MAADGTTKEVSYIHQHQVSVIYSSYYLDLYYVTFFAITGGVTWIPTTAPYGNWVAVISDSTGKHLAAVQSRNDYDYKGYIYISATGTTKLLL